MPTFTHEGSDFDPVPHLYSSIAQLVEHAAVNRVVVGSSPTWGAINAATRYLRVAAFLLNFLWAFSSVG